MCASEFNNPWVPIPLKKFLSSAGWDRTVPQFMTQDRAYNYQTERKIFPPDEEERAYNFALSTN